MKSVKIIISVCILMVLYSSPIKAAFEDRIVAIVNNEIITLSELNEASSPFLQKIEKDPQAAQDEAIKERARLMVLNNLISDILIRQKATDLGITVRDEEIEKAVENIMANKDMTIEEFKDILVKNGTTLDDYKKEIKQHLTKIKLISREIRPKIAVSDKEIGDYYSKHRDDYEGKETNRIKQILIVVPEDCDEETKEKLREKAEMVLEKLKEGEPFDLMASRYSQGPAAEAGGDLGFVEINAMFPAVDKVAFELEKGEISDVIESPIGFHIIMVADKRGTGIKPIEEVKEEIKDMIANKKTEGKFQQWIEDLRKKSLIEILLYE